MAAFDRMKGLGLKVVRINRPDYDEVIVISNPNTNTIYHNIGAKRGANKVMFVPINH